jgi:polar amino acid transport system substrate-binding protein
VHLQEGRLHGVLPELLQQVERVIGCSVEAPLTPRNRLVRMFFETHEADVLCPAVHSPRRDAIASFVSFYKGQACLVTRSDRAHDIKDAQGLLAQGALSGAIVGTFSFGPVYDELVRALGLQRRITMVRDNSTALRMVEARRVDFTLLNALSVQGEAAERSVESYETFRLTSLSDLPMFDGGAYISRHTRSQAEQRRLISAFEALREEGHVMRALRRHYPMVALLKEFGVSSLPPLRSAGRASG